MRAVVQRVSQASVSIDGQLQAAIGNGMLVLLGIAEEDSAEDIEWICGKLVRLRIFDDAHGVMNLSLCEGAKRDLLLVSQFTLMASTRRGNRPSYIRAARPDVARPLYERVVDTLSRELNHPVATGVFGADMQVALVNDGPVTILLDSKQRE